MRISQGDSVVVISGKDKGKKGTVMRVLHSENRVIVGGINMITKHIKRTPQSEGRRVKLEHSIHVSNIMIVDPKTGKPTRIGYRIDEKGKKVRIAKKSGTPLERTRIEASETAKLDATAADAKKPKTAFWKKGSKAAGVDGAAGKADAGPAQSTVTHARSAGRGS